MADYQLWKEESVTQVYCLDVPANYAEVSKMINGAEADFTRVHGRRPYDNEIEVTTRDGSVIASFRLEAERQRS